MFLELKDKVILITGSTAGIGKQMALTFIQEGAIVVVNGRSMDRILATIETIKAAHPLAKLYTLEGDISDAEGVAKLLNNLTELSLFPIYAVVNNTGIFESKSFEEVKDSDWTFYFETNVMSGVRLAKALLPDMLARNSGTILFVSSEAALAPKGNMIHYSMTKTAQLSISRGLAELTKGTNVRVNSILPGPTMTEGVRKYMEGIARDTNVSFKEAVSNYFKEFEPSSLIQRFETPEEIANVACFMISPLASAVTGRSWLVDGGVVRHI